jgi:uncharacterized protein (DUF1330 family)
MAAYVIGAISSVKDPAGFAEYQKLAGPTLEKYGGKFIAGGNKIEVADGIWSPAFVVVVEFQSLQRAKQWYNSPEYKPLVSRRKASSTSGVIFVDGS